MDWWLEQDGPSGELVVRNGDEIDELFRPASWYLFDHTILYPTISLLPAHFPYTLAQRGVLRLEDAIQAIDDLIRVLDDDRFRNSPFSECRDDKKTEKLEEGLAALRASITESAKDLDFVDVFLERQDLMDKFPRIIEADKALIRGFGLEPLPIEPGKTLRISILPLSAASLKGNPHRIITPVLHYVNADPTSGKYPHGDSVASLEFEIRYLCLRKLEVGRIRRLLDEGQTPSDIDLIMAPDTVNGFGYHLSRISTQARWRLDPEIANEVQREVSKIDAEFDIKFAGMQDVQIFNDFRTTNESLQK